MGIYGLLTEWKSKEWFEWLNLQQFFVGVVCKKYILDKFLIIFFDKDIGFRRVYLLKRDCSTGASLWIFGNFFEKFFSNIYGWLLLKFAVNFNFLCPLPSSQVVCINQLHFFVGCILKKCFLESLRKIEN